MCRRLELCDHACVEAVRAQQRLRRAVEARDRDPDLANLNSAYPSHDHSPLHCRKRSTHEVRKHPPTEAVAVRKQLFSGALPAAMYRHGLVTPTVSASSIRRSFRPLRISTRVR
jgi:hypothetical protein